MFLHNHYFFNGHFSFTFYCIIHLNIIKDEHLVTKPVDEYFLIIVLSYFELVPNPI